MATEQVRATAAQRLALRVRPARKCGLFELLGSRATLRLPALALAALKRASVFERKALFPRLLGTFFSTLLEPSVMVKTQQPFTFHFPQGFTGGKLEGRRKQARWRGRAKMLEHSLCARCCSKHSQLPEIFTRTL